MKASIERVLPVLNGWSTPGSTTDEEDMRRHLAVVNHARLRVVAWFLVGSMPTIAGLELVGLWSLGLPEAGRGWVAILMLRLLLLALGAAYLLRAGQPTIPSEARPSHLFWQNALMGLGLALVTTVSVWGQPVRAGIQAELGFPFATSIGGYLLTVFTFAAFVHLEGRRSLFIYVPSWALLMAGLLYASPVWPLALPDLVNGTLMTALALVVNRIIYLSRVSEYLNQRLVERHRERLWESNRRLAESNSRLAALSTLDPLTGIPNRRHFQEDVAKAWSRAVGNASPLAIIIADIDYFKPYNDTFGHQLADECLVRVAEAGSLALSPAVARLARYGGDEFAAVLPDADLRLADLAAEEVRRAVSALAIPHPSAPAGHVTVSIGIAGWVPIAGQSPEKMVAAADEALFRSKALGRNRCAGIMAHSALPPEGAAVSEGWKATVVPSP